MIMLCDNYIKNESVALYILVFNHPNYSNYPVLFIIIAYYILEIN
jgi:hypothetical protein